MVFAAINYGISQSAFLGSLLFLLDINDLYQAIKFCKLHHFTDDSNLLFLGNSIKTLNKPVWKHLINWLNENKTSLKVKKAETVIFQ